MMRVKVFAYIFLICLSGDVLNATTHLVNQLECLHLKGMAIFDGDKYGDFKNDAVAILSDSSAWKVHPLDQGLFCHWNIEDAIHIRLRRSFYWFKREHKFELFNANRQEVVRVMLVQYPHDPLVIVEAKTYLADYHIAHYTTIDSRGNIQYHYYPVYTCKTRLQLNDGSFWTTGQNDHYEDGAHVYLFFDPQDEGSYILIKGIEREATWHKVAKE
jgi:hypothetical protein